MALDLECIGEPTERPTSRRSARLAQFRRDGGPWAAEIVGVRADGEMIHRWMRGLRDYSHANRRGTRGVTLTYLLREGRVYTVRTMTGWRAYTRYFCTVRSGVVVRITREEVTAWPW